MASAKEPHWRIYSAREARSCCKLHRGSSVKKKRRIFPLRGPPLWDLLNENEAPTSFRREMDSVTEKFYTNLFRSSTPVPSPNIFTLDTKQHFSCSTPTSEQICSFNSTVLPPLSQRSRGPALLPRPRRWGACTEATSSEVQLANSKPSRSSHSQHEKNALSSWPSGSLVEGQITADRPRYKEIRRNKHWLDPEARLAP